jgi:hypothetical protein
VPLLESDDSAAMITLTGITVGTGFLSFLIRKVEWINDHDDENDFQIKN